jgi:hydroxyacylglutathione hydrolase
MIGITAFATGRTRQKRLIFLMLDIVQIPAGPLLTNAFLVVDSDTSEAMIVDAPPESAALIHSEVTARNLKPVMLLITHGHWDHIEDTAVVRDRYEIPVLVHELDSRMLENPGEREFPPVTADRLLADGDTVELGEHRFAVIHTPGHCPGQISLYHAPGKTLLGGDTLFPNGYGRVDIPGASESDTLRSLERLLDLPDETTVYTGHGNATTIGRERGWMEQVVASGQLFS